MPSSGFDRHFQFSSQQLTYFDSNKTFALLHREGGHHLCDSKLPAQQKINGIFPFLLALCFCCALSLFDNIFAVSFLYRVFYYHPKYGAPVRYMIKTMMIMHLSVANFSTEWSLFCFNFFYRFLGLSSVHIDFQDIMNFKSQKKEKVRFNRTK